MHAMTAVVIGTLVRGAGVALFTFALGAGSVAMAGERLYLFTQNYPPLHASTTGKGFAHSADDIEGVCSDMVKAILARAGYDYVMKMRAWSYAFERGQGNENHGVFCTARTDEREDLFQWVGPLMSLRWTLFAAPGSSITLASLEDARGMRIAGYKGDVMSEYLLERGFNMTMGAFGAVNARRLVLDQADLWVADAVMGPMVARSEYGIEGLRPVLEFKETPLYLSMSKETSPEIVAGLQRALDAARHSGQLGALVQLSRAEPDRETD